MQNQFLPPETSVEASPCIAPSATDVTQPKVMEEMASMQAAAGLLTQAQGKIRRRRKRNFAAFAVFETLCFLMLPLIWAVNATHGGAPSMTRFYVLISLILTLAALPMTWIMLATVDIDLETLAQSGGVGAIPTLIDAITLNASQKYRKRVTRALTLLLPLLKASDANLLAPRHRHTLSLMLGSCFQPHLRGVDEAFTLAILKAYEQVGDAKAVPVVEKIANHRPRNDNQRRIQQAAAECLPLLRANLGDVASTQTLLRASTFQTNTPNILLRPAVTSAPTLPAELLRPAPNEDALLP